MLFLKAWCPVSTVSINRFLFRNHFVEKQDKKKKILSMWEKCVWSSVPPPAGDQCWFYYCSTQQDSHETRRKTRRQTHSMTVVLFSFILFCLFYFNVIYSFMLTPVGSHVLFYLKLAKTYSSTYFIWLFLYLHSFTLIFILIFEWFFYSIYIIFIFIWLCFVLFCVLFSLF